MNNNDSGDAAADPKRGKGWNVFVYILVGLLSTALLGAAKIGFEHTETGHDFELWVFDKLQGQLSSIDRDNPIVLLDIGGLPGGRAGEPTPREPLLKIIEALAEQRPRAIAVDVEFSPKPNDWATPDDPEFFDSCLELSKKKNLPIYLAVGERKAAAPHEWLGQEEYKDLAVAVAANPDDTSRLPISVRAKGSREELKTMGYALAKKYRDELPGAPEWIDWAVKKTGEDAHVETQGDGSDLVYSERLVNYSKLDAMENAAQKDLSPESVAQTGKLYEKKLVILGAVTGFVHPDSFNVPGRKTPVGGVLLHASSAYTFLKEPLFELRPGLRLLLDFAIAGLIIAAVAVIRFRNPGDTSWHSRQALFIYAAIVCVLLAGWLLVRMSGVLWLDFLLVAFALFLHPKMEGLIDALRERRARKKASRKEREGQQGRGAADTRPAEATGGGVSKAVALVVVPALAFALTPAARAQETAKPCPERIAAVARSFKAKKGSGTKSQGACYFRDNKNEAWQRLSEKDVKEKQFRAGQELCCDQDCSLMVLLCGTLEEYEITRVRDKDKPYRVQNAYSAPPMKDRHPAVPARAAHPFAPANPSVETYESAAMAQLRAKNYTALTTVRSLGHGIVVMTPSPGVESERLAATTTPGSTASTASTPSSSSEMAATAMHAGAETAAARATPTPVPFEQGVNILGAQATASTQPAAAQTSTHILSAQSNVAVETRVATTASTSPATTSPSPHPTPSAATAASATPATETVSASTPSSTERGLMTTAASEHESGTKLRLLSQRFSSEVARVSEERRKFYDALREGNAARDAGDYAAAERAYALSMIFVPYDARAYYGLGNVYADQQKWDEAERAYRQALASDPHFGPAHAALGFVLSRPGADGAESRERLSAAESFLWRAAELGPSDDKVYDLIGGTIRRRGAGQDELLRAYLRAAALNPFSVKVRLLLRDELARAGKAKEAEEQLSVAERMASTARDFAALAEAQESRRSYRKAEQSLRRALAREPGNPQTLYDLGRVLVLRKRYGRAVGPLKEAAEASPGDFAPRFLLALTYLQRRQLSEAEQALNIAAQVVTPESRERLALAYGFSSVGDAYSGAGLPRLAARAYERALQFDPDEAEVEGKLALALRQAGRSRDAPAGRR